jgi:hypothetical protein
MGYGQFWCRGCRKVYRTRPLPEGVVAAPVAGGPGDRPYELLTLSTPHFVEDVSFPTTPGAHPSSNGEMTVEARADVRFPNPTEPKPELIVNGNDITMDGTTYHLDDAPAAFVQALAGAKPRDWVPGTKMSNAVQPRPDRVFKRLPGCLRARIESEPGKGYRFRPGVAYASYAK